MAIPSGKAADEPRVGDLPRLHRLALGRGPGEGGFPLAELLAAVPSGTPISVEVPHARLQARLSAREFAAYDLRAVQALLAREGTHVV